MWRDAARLAFSGGVPRRSFAVALVVGTILNLINQGDALVAGAPLDGTKLALTFVVPYCVATYGAVSLALSRARSPRRQRAAEFPARLSTGGRSRE